MTADELCTPWSLTFDRDGTEDFGIITDAKGNVLVASHFPDHDFLNTFWLPETDDDTLAMPTIVQQMRFMTVAPRLLVACKMALAALEKTLEADDPQARTQMEWDSELLATLRSVLIKAGF